MRRLPANLFGLGPRSLRAAVHELALFPIVILLAVTTTTGVVAQPPSPPLLEPVLSPPPSVERIAPSFSDAMNSGNATDAKEKSIEQRLSDLEDGFEEQEKTLGSFLEPGHSGATMKVVGRIHLDYWAFPGDSPGVNAFESGDPTIDPQDRFVFRRIRFGVRGDILDNMEYRIEMEFAGGEDTQYRDVWIGFKDLPWFRKVLIGNQKRPYGLDHLNSSRFNVFIERPFVTEAFNQDSRRLGVASHGVSKDEVFNWRYGVYNQRLIQDEEGHINDHYQPELAGRLASTVWYDELSEGRSYAHLGLAGTVAWPDGSAANDGIDDNEGRFRTRPEARSSSRWLDTGFIDRADTYTLIGAEAVLNLGALQLVSEYQNVFLQRDEGFGPDLNFHGAYAYASYFLTGEHMPWERRSGTLGRVQPFKNFFLVDRFRGRGGQGWGAWQLAARWSYLDLTDMDITGGVGNSVTLGLNWYWNAYSRLQFNVLYGDVEERGPIDGETAGDYTIVGARCMIDF